MNGFIIDVDSSCTINNVAVYTRSQVRAARIKWAEFLMAKGRKKATGLLDSGEGHRCCLGHGAYILGIKGKKLPNGHYAYEDETDIAPQSLIEMVGLWDDTGMTNDGTPIKIFKKKSNHDLYDLAGVNDNTNASPRRIGKYLLSVVEGGYNTPFRPLEDYPE